MRQAVFPERVLMFDLTSMSAYQRGRAVQDLIFIGLIVLLYLITHALVAGLARLGRIE
jgi:hypothetical protein